MRHVQGHYRCINRKRINVLFYKITRAYRDRARLTMRDSRRFCSGVNNYFFLINKRL